MIRKAVGVLVLLWASTVCAQPVPQAVADAATFGAVAAQSSLCGLRDEAWAEDLRKATQQLPADREHLVAALGYGDMEANEDFAADKPEVVCPALQANPALARADALVAAYRAQSGQKPLS